MKTIDTDVMKIHEELVVPDGTAPLLSFSTCPVDGSADILPGYIR